MVSTLVYITYNYINLQAFIQFLITSNYKLFNIINLDMRYDQNFSQCSSIYRGTTFQLKKECSYVPNDSQYFHVTIIQLLSDCMFNNLTDDKVSTNKPKYMYKNHYKVKLFL